MLRPQTWADLSVFADVATCGSFAGAARRTGASQAAVVRQVTRLEALVGQPLLARTSRGVRTTEVGSRVMAEAVAMAHAARDLTCAARSQDQRPAVVLTHALRLVPLLRELAAGACTRRWRAGAYGGRVHALAQLLAGDADLVVGCVYDYEKPEMPAVPRRGLAHEDTFVILPADHRLAGAPGALDLEHLKDDPWILGPDPGLRELVLRRCRSAGFEPQVAHDTDDSATTRALIAEGCGVSLAPPTVDDAPGYVLKPYENPSRRHIFVAWNPRLINTKAEQTALLAAVRRWYACSIQDCTAYLHWIETNREHLPRWLTAATTIPPPTPRPTAAAQAPATEAPPGGQLRAQDWTDLRVLLEVGNHRSMSAAAASLGLSQSSVTRHLQRLEKRLGQELVRRDARGTTLTGVGVNAFRTAETMHRAATRLCTLEPVSGHLALACFDVSVPTLLDALARPAPHVRWKSRSYGGATPEMSLLRNGDLDLLIGAAFDFEEITWPVLRCEHLITEQTWIALPHQHPLADQATLLNLEQLADDDWMVEPDGVLREAVLRRCREAGFEPRLTHETADVAQVRALLGGGHGVTLGVPTVLDSDAYVIRPYAHPIARRLFVAWSPAADAVLPDGAVLEAARHWYTDCTRRSSTYARAIDRQPGHFPDWLRAGLARVGPQARVQGCPGPPDQGEPADGARERRHLGRDGAPRPGRIARRSGGGGGGARAVAEPTP